MTCDFLTFPKAKATDSAPIPLRHDKNIALNITESICTLFHDPCAVIQSFSAADVEIFNRSIL